MGEITDPYEQKGSGIVDPYAKPAEPDMGGAAAFGEGAKQGATFGLSDELAGASAAAPKGALDYTPRRLQGIAKPILGAARLGINAVTGNDPEAELTYNMERDAARKRDELAAKQHPIAHGVGEVTGALPTMAVLPEAQMARAPALLRPVLRGAQVGSEYGAASGFGHGEGLSGSLAGVGIGTGVGMVGGAGAGAAGQLLSNVIGGSVGKAIGVFNGWKDPEGEGARRLSQALLKDQEMIAAGDAKGMTAQKWLEAKRAGEPVTLADLGSGYTQEMLRSAANTSPEAWARLEKFLDERFRGQGERVAQDVRGLVAGGANAGKSADQLVAEYDLARAPAYKAAYEQGDKEITSPVIERLMGSPRFVTAMKNAVSSGQDRAVTQGLGAFNPGVTVENGIIKFTRTGPTGVPQYPNLQYWDAVKKELDGMASVAARSGDKGAAEVAGNQAKLLREQLDKQVPSYANARGVAEQFFGERNALEAGAKMNKRNTDPRDIQQAMSKMKPDERELFREGYATDWADRLIANMSERRDITKAMFTSPNERARALAVFGESGLAKIETRLALETVMQGAKNAMGNSTTMKQLFAAGLAGGALAGGYESGWNPTHMGIGAIGGAGALSGAGATRLGHELISNGLKKFMGGVDSKASAYISELLTSNDLTQMQKGIDLATKNKRFADALRQIANYTFIGGQTPASSVIRSARPVISRGLTADQEDQKPATAGFASGGIVADRKADGAIRMLRAMRAKPKPRLKKKERAEGGMIKPGTIDLANRPVVHNADGSISTVRSIGTNVDGKEMLLPTVYGQSILNDDDAVRLYRMSGQHLGQFDSPAASDAYAQQLHEDQAQMYQGRASGGSVKALRDATNSFAEGGMPGGDTTDFYSGEVLPADGGDWRDREAQANLAAQGETPRSWGNTWQGIKDFPSRLAQHDPNAPPSETFPILDQSNIVNAGANLIRGGAESIKSGVTAAGRALSGEMPMWDQEGHTSPEAVQGAFDAASLPVGGGVVTGIASAAGKSGAVVAAAEHAPRFYSHLEKTVEDLPFKTGTADQVLNTLTNKGVKQAELEATGTLDYLASKGGEKVSKDELLAHIAQNKVELGQVIKGERPAGPGGEWLGPGRYRMEGGAEWSPTTKFSQYQLPGGENYKEKLLTLPEKNTSSQRSVMADRLRQKYGDNFTDEWTPAEKAAYEGTGPAPSFKSSHWDEPNVLAHTRSNEREVNGVPSHHIEEIQSDWAAKLLKNPDSVPPMSFSKNYHELAIKDALSDAVAAGKSRISWTPGEAQVARYDLSKHLDRIEYEPVLDDAGKATGKYEIYAKDKNGKEVFHEDEVGLDRIAEVAGKEIAQKIEKNEGSKANSEHNSAYRDWHALTDLDLKVGGEFHKKLYDQKVPQVLNKIGKPHGVKVERGTTSGTQRGWEIFDREGGRFLGNARSRAEKDTAIAEGKFVKPDATADGSTVHYMDIPPSLADQIRTKGFSLFEDSSAGAPIAALEQTNSRARDPALWHGISDVKLPKPISEMSAEHVPTNPLRETSIRPADLQGSRLLPLIGDRSAAGSNLTRVNGFQFGQPVEMQGGHGFMPANVDTGAAWASGKSVVRGLANKVTAAAERGPVHGVYTAMGERSVDFSHHVSDTLSEMLKHTKIRAADKLAFNEAMRRQDANFKAIEDWPGLNSKKLREYLASAPGEVRNKFAKTMDTRKFQMLGFPSVAEARFAVTDPRLLHEPTGAAGLSVAQLDPTGHTFQTGAQHRSYDTNLAGKYIGGLPTSIPKEVMYPDILKAIDKYRRGMTGYVPTSDYLMARTPKGLPLTQKVDQKWVDSVSKYLQNRGHSGLARGGKVTKKKLLTSSALQTAYAMKRQG